jgi:hypothetical protein
MNSFRFLGEIVISINVPSYLLSLAFISCSSLFSLLSSLFNGLDNHGIGHIIPPIIKR